MTHVIANHFNDYKDNIRLATNGNYTFWIQKRCRVRGWITLRSFHNIDAANCAYEKNVSTYFRKSRPDLNA